MSADAFKPEIVLDQNLDTKQYRDKTESDTFYQIKERAKPVLAEFGRTPPQVRADDTPRAYRARIMNSLIADTKFAKMPKALVNSIDFNELENAIYSDAYANRRHPVGLNPGEIKEIKKTDSAGRIISEFVSGGSAFREVYGACMTVPVESPVYIDGVPQRVPVQF